MLYEAPVTVDATKFVPRIGEIYGELSESINASLSMMGFSERVCISQRVQALVLRVESEQEFSEEELEAMRDDAERRLRDAMPDLDYQVEPLRSKSRQSSCQSVSP